MLGGGRVGADQQHAPVSDMPQRGPHLLTVNHEFVAIQRRTGVERGQIRAGARFGEALAPDLLAGQDFLDETALLLFGAVLENSRSAHRQAEFVERCWRSDTGHFFVEYRTFDDGFTLAAVLGRPRNSEIAGVVEPPLPVSENTDGILIDRQRKTPVGDSCRPVRFQPFSRFEAKLHFLGAVAKIHAYILYLKISWMGK